MKYTAIVDDQRAEIELNRILGDRIEVRIGGRTYDLEAKSVEPGVYWLNHGNRPIELAVTPNGDGYVVSFRGHRLAVEMVDSRKALRRAAQQGHDGAVEIRAPMPGKIVKVLVSEGVQVKANQGILVMEAMKMQNEIKSPKTGTVLKLTIAEGAAVSSGDLLAAVE